MKNLFYAVSIIMALAISGVTFAQQPPTPPSSGVKIALVDLNRIIEEHPISLEWDKELNNRKAVREDEVKEQIRSKYGVTDESQLSETQKTDVQRFIMMENEKFRQEMLPERNDNLKKIEQDIINYSAIIANEKGYSLVVDRVAVIFGGTDITEDVLALIKKKGQK